ncbi:MAG TPA: nucleotidyltransferase domain-containing protein [Bryobacteraceae bacterium]|jgi:predicted nucleotidyltransferase|nr:nucleotidyltransferase domain-containing protein [Bryobacteraceae bacterium]
MSPAARQIVSDLTSVLVEAGLYTLNGGNPASHPKRVVLFGSQASGDSTQDSDFDIMVVEEKPADRFAEMVRLNRLIRSFDIAVDLLVVSDEKFQYWRETSGNVYYEAATRGQVLYQAA